MPAVCHFRFQHLRDEKGRLKSPPETASIRPGSLRAWALALRPRSFAVAASPVLLGVALAYWETGAIDSMLAMAAFICALLMQAITNLQNDVGFHQRGGEAAGGRVGLPRASTLGLLRPSDLRTVIFLLSLASVAAGALLASARGWQVLVLGSASLLAALAYMGGPRPIAYTPLGEGTVLIFFGGVAVLGTVWLLGAPLSAPSCLVALSAGCLAAAALAVNNHRDRHHDQSLQRRTFAVTWGERASRRLYAVLLATPLLIVPVLAWLAGTVWLALPLALLPRVRRLYRDFASAPEGHGFNPILFRTFLLLLEYAVLQSLGLLAARGFG